VKRCGRRYNALCARALAAQRDLRHLSPEEAVALVAAQRTRLARERMALALRRTEVVEFGTDLAAALIEMDPT
jgi:hypothetical protein